MKFRKKPVVIEAVRVEQDPGSVLDFLGEVPLDHAFVLYQDPDTQATYEDRSVMPPEVADRAKPILQIRTLEGVMTANVGDWVIRGVKGEYYPCAPDIFEQTYEAVEDTDGE